MSDFTLDTSGVALMPSPGIDEPAHPVVWSDLSPFEQGYVEAMFASIAEDPYARKGPPPRAKLPRSEERLQEALSFLTDYSENMRKHAPRGEEADYAAVYWIPREPSYSWPSTYGDFQPATLKAGIAKGFIERKRDGFHEYRITPQGRAALHADYASQEACAGCNRPTARTEAACIQCGKTKDWAQPPGFSDLSPEALARILKDCEAILATGWGQQATSEDGARTWEARQRGSFRDFPPSIPYLADDGKVHLRGASQ